MKIKSLQLLAFIIAVSAFQDVHALSLSDAAQRLTSEIGTQDAINATATCELSRMSGNAGGNFATPNMLMCLIKNLGLTATTGDTGITRELDTGGGTVTAHIVLTSPGPTVDGTTYAYELKVWTCGSGCTTVNNFLPAVWAAFDANASKTVNKGILVNNFGAQSGQLQGSSFIRWNTGGGSTVRTIDLVMVDCSNYNSNNSNPVTAILLKYTRTGSVSTMNDIVSQASGAVTRTAMAWNTSNNTGNWQQDTTVGAGGDSPAWSGGFTRTATTTDWTYSAASTSNAFTIAPYPSAVSGTTLSGSNYQGITCSSIYTSGVPYVVNGTGVLTTPMTANGGMTTRPANL